MKKFLLIFFLSSILTVSAATDDVINKIENEFYGFTYSGENKNKRVERLEKSIYGKVSSGEINKRITKLSCDISADVIGLEIPPVRDTFMEEEKTTEEESVNYPIVDKIEKQLFGTTYQNRDFHTRIVTIEKKLFGKIYDVDDYAKRMDRIKAKILPETIVYDEYNNHNFDSLKSADLGGTGNNRFRMPFGQRNYTRPYTNYGDFSGMNTNLLPHDNLNDDLTQLEYDVFGTEFSSDDTQTRIKRLNSARQAKKSYKKYDSSKFSQRMSTAMEIGAMILMILAMVL